MIAQEDDEALFNWIMKAHDMGGDFIKGITQAALHADHDNYAELRPLLVKLRKKYPAYNEQEKVS